jgi:hypothetical protein
MERRDDMIVALAGSLAATARASSKSLPATINSPPNASMAAFFSAELPSGTTMSAGMPACLAAIATD